MNLSLRTVAIRIAVIVGIVYASSLGGSFHFDDSHSVESNLAIRSLKNIPSFWTDPRTSSFIAENRVYRPLVYTFYSFCWLVGQGSAFPFHVMKMGMHVMVVLALFQIWLYFWSQPGWLPVRGLRLRLPLFSQTYEINAQSAAFFLAVIFAIHPAGSECVDYVAATTSLQCAMFYVWAFVFHLRHRDSGRGRDLSAALILYFCAVASKEEGITLPAMVLITELFLLSQTFRSRILPATKRALPYAALGICLAAWIFYMHPAEGNESRGWVQPHEYFMTQWRIYLWYMKLWFWPWGFNADDASTVFSKSFTDPLVIQSAIGNLLLLWLGWVTRKKFPALLFGLIWFYVTISPASSVVVLAEASNEHRMYLAYIGFVGGTFTLLLAAVEKFWQSPKRAQQLGWLYAAILACLVIGTQERNRVWANDENLWSDTLEKNPTSGRAMNNLALVYMARGEFEKTLEPLKKCEIHWPTYAICSVNRGVSLQAMAGVSESAGRKDEAARQYKEAEQAFLRAYSLNPKNVHVNFHLGELHERVHKDYAKAIEYYRSAARATGGRYPAAELRIADCLVNLKKFDEAISAIDIALSLEPDSEQAWFQKGKLELDLGRNAAAVATYAKLLEIRPNHLLGHYNLGVAKLALSDLRGARDSFEKVVAIDTKSEQGWYNLSYTLERLGEGQGALAAAKRLSEIRPERSDFRARVQELEKKYAERRS